MSVEVNSHLAEINLPQTRFDNMLTALGRATETNAATEGDPEDEAPADKRYVAIEPLDFVKPAGVVVEYVHDHTAVIDENPLLLRHTLA